MMDTLFLWIAAFLTLSIFSFLYRDNPFYKIAEHIYVGTAAAYWFIYLYFFDIKPKLIDAWILNVGLERYILLVPGFLSLLMLLRFIPPLAWLSRWAIAFTVGMAAGLGITGSIQGYIVPQLKASILPLWTGELFSTVNNLILVFSTLTVLIYFFFSLPHKGGMKILARIGITFIMIAFGASFGSTIMARISLLIGRIYFLLSDWLKLI